MPATVVAALFLAAPVAARSDPVFADIPGIAVTYYDVPGRTPGAIRTAMEKLRPTDPNDRQRVDALSSWWWRWSWKGTAHGCDLAGATLSYSATVLMPRLADRSVVPARVLAAWDAYVARLQRHEAWHVRNGYSGQAEIRAAIAGATCATANAAAQAAIGRIGAREAEYDRRTHHGIDDSAAF